MGDDPDPDRRKFLTLATCGVGGAVGLAVVAPALSLVIDPARRQTVTTPKDPIDIGDVRMIGTEWRRLDVIAPEVRDAWVTARNVVLGAAFVRRREPKPGANQSGENQSGENQSGEIEALSASCPHLGCPVGWESAKQSFLCPCHNSRFGTKGEIVGDGPAKRGLDPLPIQVENGRLRLTWMVYKLDTESREPV